MNDYLSGVIYACDALTETGEEFKKAVMKATGMTRSGIAGDKEIQARAKMKDS